MALIFEMAASVFILGLLYIFLKATESDQRVREYICFYKIGRIIQMAEKRGVNLMQVKADDKLFFEKGKTFEDTIESELSGELSIDK